MLLVSVSRVSRSWRGQVSDDVIMSCEQRCGEAEGSGDHEREAEAAGAAVQDAL